MGKCKELQKEIETIQKENEMLKRTAGTVPSVAASSSTDSTDLPPEISIIGLYEEKSRLEMQVSTLARDNERNKFLLNKLYKDLENTRPKLESYKRDKSVLERQNAILNQKQEDKIAEVHYYEKENRTLNNMN